LGTLSRDLVPSSWCARSCLLVAPCETIALDDAFRTEDVVALVLPTSAASLTGHGCCHVPRIPAVTRALSCAALVSFAPSQPNQLDWKDFSRGLAD
ncbi:MAG: hypothetical protein ACM3ZE_22055, partial [Myxococcales bacterium]